ncbi:rhomboid family intramembrane serine protease [Bacillus sp. BRMEA1]|uniref:rhomboid family intramembrane serine protease n=1 Tax=Neobacillus endophyticus TaxID=2738405 RepID=UPI0015644F5E|nr:rhomboid family intramembrane serine protease [Neobacillus endophyticus]NRD80753.1 rhomboid family intramembrane serine protease [Neobacillus endophyticus]
MDNKEAYNFWTLAHTFINDHGYRMIQLFENQKELWLEKLENRDAPIIRMLLHNIDWSNAMQRDIEFTAANGENVRKQLNRNKLHMINIYISELPPVDEYEYRLAKPYLFSEGGRTEVSSFLFSKDMYEKEMERLSERLGKKIFIPVQDHSYLDEEVETLKRATLEQAVNRIKDERAILMNSKPFFTYVFIFINAAVFLLEQLNGGSTNSLTLVRFGAKVNDLIYEGEWWRFITPIFLHIGFLHLVMNTLALYYLGVTVERIFGNIRFPFIYLFAGFTGVLASFLFSNSLSVGASGAIYGCFGALLYFGATFPKLFFRTMGTNLFVVLGINLIFSFSAAGIDSAGHIGGLVGGFLAAGIIHFPKKRKLLYQLFFLIVSIVSVYGALTFGFGHSING